MELLEKLQILSDAAKYDVACTSSGVDRKAGKNGIGSSLACGICHSFAGDGRCISLLKVLLTNICGYDCKYCVNRCSNDVPRAVFSPRELADLTIAFYRRNYIEGLFLSSGILRNPDYTTEQMIETLRILREEYKFSGYIHAKAIPGADNALLEKLGILADRMSVNIEMPSKESLRLLAPDKTKYSILGPMGFIRERIVESTTDLVKYKSAPRFVPAGQSTQMIVGATGESDWQIIRLSEGLYRKYGLKRVFFSAYVPVAANNLLPALDTKPPVWREHRLYQADWLMRFYGFRAAELLDETDRDFHPYVDPKCYWALRHGEHFPLEINRAPYESLLRVPGIGVRSAKRIVIARRMGALDFDDLKKLGVVLKRARYFILCRGKKAAGLTSDKASFLQAMMSPKERRMYRRELGFLQSNGQLSLFEEAAPLNRRQREALRCLTLPM